MDKNLTQAQLLALTNIGKNVQYIRKNILSLTLVQTSKWTGVSRDVLCRLEALASGEGKMGSGGRVYPSIMTIIKFSESVGLTPGELIDKVVADDPTLEEKVIRCCTLPL